MLSLQEELKAHISSSIDTTLEPRTLQRNTKRHPSRLLDLPRRLLLRILLPNKHRLHPRYQLLSKVQPRLEQIRDDNRFGTSSSGGEQCDEANGAGAADEKGVAEAEVGAFYAGEGDGEGFAEGAFFKGDVVGETVEPLGGVNMPSGERSCGLMVRREETRRV